MSFNTTLVDLLKTDPRLVDDDGELIIAAVQDLAWQTDRDLVKRLLSDLEVKATFFDEIEDYWIFLTNKFLDYISQKNFLDNSYTRFRNRIGLTIGGKYLSERGEVALVWPYKDTVLEGGQTNEEEKRNEIFFNEVLAQDEINRLFDPKVLTGFTRHTVDGEQPVEAFKRDDTGQMRENLIIKGNNLLALHTLKTQFRGRVKLIYIDPPYNTGNDDFGYTDSFNHSAWLTFMKSRLEIARELLSMDGSIWINIDDNEAHYLKILCDEIFGRTNFVTTVIWRKNYAPKSSAKYFSEDHDYIFVYAKAKENWQRNLMPRADKQNNLYKNPDNDPRGRWRPNNLAARNPYSKGIYSVKTPSGRIIEGPPQGSYWRISKEKLEELDKQGRIWWGKDGNNVPAPKIYLSEVQDGIVPQTYWSFEEVGHTQEAKREIVALADQDIFATPKPERLLRRILEIATNPSDLVVDFFLGSGTTAAVAQKMGRQYIGIEQMDYVKNIPVERLKKVIEGEQGGISKSINWQGGGDFIYCELMPYNQVFMDRIQAATSSDELLLIWQAMAAGSFLNWYVNPEVPEDAIKDFKALGQEEIGLEKQKHLLAELLDKNQLYVNLSEIEDAQFNVSEQDKALNKAFYGDTFNA